MSPATLAVGQPGLVVDLFAGAGGWSEGLRTLAAPNVATPTCSSSWPTRRPRPVAETLLLDQLTLAPPAAAGLHRVAMADANDLLACWRHYLGPCHRPLGQQGWVLHVAGRPLAVTVNASTVSAQITRHERDSKIGKLVPTRSWRARQLVELALCAIQRWATRVILRLGAPDQQGRRQHRDPTPGLPTHGDEP